jgi:hypothetical protein
MVSGLANVVRKQEHIVANCWSLHGKVNAEQDGQYEYCGNHGHGEDNRFTGQGWMNSFCR